MDVKSMKDIELVLAFGAACTGIDIADEIRLRSELLSRLRELSELREQTRWIPASERLPECGEIVLWSHKTWSRPKEGYMTGSGRLNVWGGECASVNSKSWRPLPLPPISTENVSNGDKTQNSNEIEDK